MPWDDPEALKSLQREMEVSILVHGCTHNPAVRQLQQIQDRSKSAKNPSNTFYALNPGSASGAYSSLQVLPEASFMLLELEGRDSKGEPAQSGKIFLYSIGSEGSKNSGEVVVSSRELVFGN